MKIMKSNLLAVIFICISCTVIGTFAYLKPVYNWDVVLYTGMIHLIEGEKDLTALHDKTFAELKAVVPEKEFSELIDSNTNIRKMVYEDPKAFMQQIPFYDCKVAYNLMLVGLHRIGIEAAKTTVVVSILSGAGIIFLLFVWFKKYFDPLPAAIISVLMMSTSVGLSLMRLSTPDAPSALMILLSIFLLVERKRFWWPSIIMTASVVLRHDNSAWLFAFLLCAVLLNRTRKTLIISSVILIVAAAYVLAMGKITNSYGFAFHFWFSFVVKHIPYPADAHYDLTVSSYLSALIEQIIGNTVKYSYMIYLSIAVSAVFFGTKTLNPKKLFTEIPTYPSLLLVFYTVLGIRTLIFPSLWDRFLFFLFTLSIIALFELIPKKDKIGSVINSEQ